MEHVALPEAVLCGAGWRAGCRSITDLTLKKLGKLSIRNPVYGLYEVRHSINSLGLLPRETDPKEDEFRALILGPGSFEGAVGYPSHKHTFLVPDGMLI